MQCSIFLGGGALADVDFLPVWQLKVTPTHKTQQSVLILNFTAFILARILEQFQLSHYSALFFLRRVAQWGLWSQNLPGIFCSIPENLLSTYPHNTTTTSPRLPNSHKFRPPLFSRHLHHAASSKASYIDGLSSPQAQASGASERAPGPSELSPGWSDGDASNCDGHDIIVLYVEGVLHHPDILLSGYYRFLFRPL